MTSMASLKYRDHYLHKEQEKEYEHKGVNEELFGQEVNTRRNASK